MTLAEAREHIGHGVVYNPRPDLAEDGVITSVNDHWVFVRYTQWESKATNPADLHLLTPEATP